MHCLIQPSWHLCPIILLLVSSYQQDSWGTERSSNVHKITWRLSVRHGLAFRSCDFRSSAFPRITRGPAIHLLSFNPTPAPRSFVPPGPGVHKLNFLMPFPIILPCGSTNWRYRWATRQREEDRRVLVLMAAAVVAVGPVWFWTPAAQERDSPFLFVPTLLERAPPE